MSWMSPSYILQSEFDELWTPLSRRYSLWLYREVEWDSVSKHEGSPVIFIPGNSGSSHQVRSIASSAARQYYSAPGTPDPTFAGLRPLDFFAVEFNEDLSALHGPTIDSQREYVSSSIAYILSTYPPPRRRVIIIGHSMGGIVARSLLTSPQKDGWNTTDIAAVITMSTPHSLAPARFDHAIDKIYSEISRWENSNKTNTVNVPTLAICGGSTDALIPSETCALPDLSPSAMKRYDASPWYRWTAHTTSLSGIWSGVGHREMVWCHQVRWRVARTALELGALSKASDSLHAGRIISRWFPSPVDNQVEHESGGRGINTAPCFKKYTPYGYYSGDLPPLSPPDSSHAYLLPVGDLQPQNLTLLIAKGVLAPAVLHSPKLSDHQGSFRLSLYFCSATGLGSHVLPESCISIDPGRGANNRLIPLPTPGRDFPDSEGVDESERIVFWNGDVIGTQKGGWVAFVVEGGTDSRGTSWAIAGFDQERIQYAYSLANNTSFWMKHGFVPFKTSVVLPDLHSHALLVYWLRTTPSGNCVDSLLPPLASSYTPPRTGSSESHFYVETTTRPIFITSHSSGPFVSSRGAIRGSILEIYTSGTCGIKELKLGIDWRASLGRAASRYWSSLGVWAVGVVGLIMASEFLDPTEALLRFTTTELPWLALLIMVLSVIPLPSYALLGNAGEVVFAPLAPLCLAMATAIVWIIWGIVLLLVRGIGEARRFMTSYFPSDSITQPYSTTQKITNVSPAELVRPAASPRVESDATSRRTDHQQTINICSSSSTNACTSIALLTSAICSLRPRRLGANRRHCRADGPFPWGSRPSSHHLLHLRSGIDRYHNNSRDPETDDGVHGLYTTVPSLRFRIRSGTSVFLRGLYDGQSRDGIDVV
ncbi:hypothetical protein BS47DRAFT_1388290 [Hydnum rufescens UP504]|uniref:GPI inositol-deacylase n=1 Tax=Hydnum rufescens UP504 TaxID=1448309 RepID=A0A9P6B7V4_9AGAM|nr:hypothetical protein BS47DRAFT_1388290 [Hydnum rufescens UP504]